ncbi:MAG: Dabb family protein [Lawsonibacter sp.]|jgi:hypothetical protein
MVYHIVSWNFKPELTAEQRKAIGTEVVARLQDLNGKIPGLLEIQAYCPPLDSSSCDLVLYSRMEQPSDLDVYQNHPDHLAVAPLIKGNFCDRRCCDFVN